MLVLRRKVNQSIVIGDSIRIVVVGVDGDSVKLGIEAPRDVGVQRAEIVHSCDETNDNGGERDQASRLRPEGQNEKH